MSAALIDHVEVLVSDGLHPLTLKTVGFD